MSTELKASLSVAYEDAIPAVTAALKAEGFGVLTEIDIKKTFKAKLDADFRKYVILGACNPNLAFKALSHDLDIGLFLGCNVIVYEDGDGSAVSIVDPLQMLDVASHPDMLPVAEDARARLTRVISSLSA